MATRDLDATGHVLLLLARLLLEAGADCEHVRQRIEAIAERMGGTAQLFLGSERLLLMLDSGQAYRTRVGHAVGTMGIDAGKLAKLESIAAALTVGDLDIGAASARLGATAQDGPDYPGWLIVIAVATTAAALARLFGAGAPVVAAAFLAGLINTALRRTLPRFGIMPAAASAINAGISGAIAILPLHLMQLDPALALVAAGMILVPGVPLINGIRDLVCGHAAIAVARLASGAMLVIAIAAGLAMASIAFGARIPIDLQTRPLSLPWDMLFAAIAAFGFSILFNVPRMAIAMIVATGAIAHGARTALMALGTDIAAATCFGSMLAGILAMQAARSLRIPWTALAFPGVVALVPGSYAFRGMIGALQIMTLGAHAPQQLVGATLAAAIAACVLTVSIGAGLLVASFIGSTTSGKHRAPAAR